MWLSFDIWRTLAGVAIFLLGMSFLEAALKQLAGRRFKLFLRKQTSSKFKAITGGAVVTGVLQSSSVVNLMVLALVGANVLTMQNALAVVLGANFGTTIDSWLVATVGFKFSIESIAFPLTAIAGISLALTKKETRWNSWFQFSLGLGFIFIGLDFMKTGIEQSVKDIQLEKFSQLPLILFLSIGCFITILIQSSSATIAMTLSALYANAISFPQAAAIVLGSEVGTTVKLFLASINGNEVKKRVAMGNLIFNITTALLVFIFLSQVIQLIKIRFGVADNLIALVLFQSLVNLISIILFIPFLNVMGRFLEKRFKTSKPVTLHLNKNGVADLDLAIDELDRASRVFAFSVISFCLDSFDVKGGYDELPFKTAAEKYEHLKSTHGDLHSFYIDLQKIATEKEHIERLDALISSIRNFMYAAKSIKDAYSDVLQLKNSSNDAKYNFYLATRENMEMFCRKLSEIILSEDRRSHFGELSAIYNSITNKYTSTLEDLYLEPVAEKVNKVEISTLINFNREAFTACKALVFGIKDYLLDKKEAAFFDDLPGFIG